MQIPFALINNARGVTQMTVQNNLHVFHPVTLLEAAKAKRLATHSSTQRVSRSLSSGPLLFSPGLGLVPSQSDPP